MTESDITIHEGLQENTLDEECALTYSITSYGADYPVDGLVKRIRDGSIFIPAFQRGYVWHLKEASRFIESLLLGLPVPGIFLSRVEESKKLLVIDGQQRLRTLQFFYDGIFYNTGREFALSSIESHFNGATYRSLTDEDKRRLDDTIIHATIVKQDEPSDDNSSIFLIFERLNTGGEHLQPQEIRSAMYTGEFNDLIKELNTNEAWRDLYGPINKRMRDQELILRFLALYYRGDEYKKSMKDFLNCYMAENKHIDQKFADQLKKIFYSTVENIQKHIGSKAFRPRNTIVAAVYDSVMIGIAHRLEAGDISDYIELKLRYDELMNTKEYITAISEHTSDEDRVATRIKLATEAFASVK